MAERKALPDDAVPEILYTVHATDSGQNVRTGSSSCTASRIVITDCLAAKKKEEKTSDLPEVVNQLSQVKLSSDDANVSALDSLFADDFLFSPEFVAQVGEE